MGNTIKRQVLTAAVTLCLFTLGSVGMATAGIFLDPDLLTKMEAKKFKGTEWCGDAAGIAIGGEEDGEKENFNNKDAEILISFGEFPFIAARLTVDGNEFDLGGFGVPKNDKKGFFTLEGEVGENGFGAGIFMNGKYKQNDTGVPTQINGKWFGMSTEVGPGINEVCTTKTGSFKFKGDGTVFVIQEP